MKPAPKYLGKAGNELAQKRFADFVRYSELVAEQEAALEAENLERFDALAHEIAELRVGVGPVGVVEELEVVRDDFGRNAAEILRQALASNRRIQERLTSLRGQDADRIRSVRERTPMARQYVKDEDAAPRARLDVTL